MHFIDSSLYFLIISREFMIKKRLTFSSASFFIFGKFLDSSLHYTKQNTLKMNTNSEKWYSLN